MAFARKYLETILVGLCLLAITLGWGQASIAYAEEAAPAIRINSIGFLPEARKIASISVACRKFSLENVSTGKTVYRGQVKRSGLDSDTDKKLWITDFSVFQEPGDYRLVIPRVGESPIFTISEHVYNRPFYTVTRGMYLWRCGTAVSGKHEGTRFHHKACHLEDGHFDHVGGRGKVKEAVGGWHDAGDYNKYVVNGAFTVGMMLHAWLQNKDRLESLNLRLPRSDASIPDFLEEIKWEIDWLLKMQLEDGRVYHKLSTEKFGGFVLPEEEKKKRYFCPWGSAATADFAAITAMASRAFRPYDSGYADKCLDAAKLSYTYLKEHPEDHRPDQSAFSTGEYNSPDADDRIWAAAELWEATGENVYLEDYENRVSTRHHSESANPSTVASVWDWANLENLGTFTYLLSSREGRDLQLLRKVREDLLSSADGIVGISSRHAYGRPMGSQYYWGCNGVVARQTMNLQIAFQLTKERKYRDTALNALGYLFGRNLYGRSFVTGLGERPPMFPHDRRCGGDDVRKPWPGYLVGGAWPSATDWRDEEENFMTNETAINWNGALIYALSGFVEPSTFEKDIKSVRKR